MLFKLIKLLIRRIKAWERLKRYVHARLAHSNAYAMSMLDTRSRAESRILKKVLADVMAEIDHIEKEVIKDGEEV